MGTSVEYNQPVHATRSDHEPRPEPRERNRRRRPDSGGRPRHERGLVRELHRVRSSPASLPRF